MVEERYFEVEMFGMVICVVPRDYPDYQQPGRGYDSIGYHGGEGMLYKGSHSGESIGTKCNVGDTIGCGLRLNNHAAERDEGVARDPDSDDDEQEEHLRQQHRPFQPPRVSFRRTQPKRNQYVQGYHRPDVVFTTNGREIGNMPLDPLTVMLGLYPAVLGCTLPEKRSK